MMRLLIITTGAAALLNLVAIGALHAAPTAEQKCQKARLDASASYASCSQKTLAKFYNGSLKLLPFNEAMSKCRVAYQGAWPKLQAKKSLAGSSCTQPRFVTNDDNSTVTDNLTGLVWEKKTDDGLVHDKDQEYYWSSGGPFSDDDDVTDADGTVFQQFLSWLNIVEVFAGNSDWRLPTLAELLTISGGRMCTTFPTCTDPVFGPIYRYDGYWTSSSDVSDRSRAWLVDFHDGQIDQVGKAGPNVDFVGWPARAVRGGW